MKKIKVNYQPTETIVLVTFMGLTKHRGVKVPCGRLEYNVRKRLYGAE